MPLKSIAFHTWRICWPLGLSSIAVATVVRTLGDFDDLQREQDVCADCPRLTWRLLYKEEGKEHRHCQLSIVHSRRP